MPKSAYYKGHGKEVMAAMNKTYGNEAERVFYATANKHPEFKPEGKVKKAMKEGLKSKTKLS